MTTISLSSMCSSSINYTKTRDNSLTKYLRGFSVFLSLLLLLRAAAVTPTAAAATSSVAATNVSLLDGCVGVAQRTCKNLVPCHGPRYWTGSEEKAAASVDSKKELERLLSPETSEPKRSRGVIKINKKDREEDAYTGKRILD